MSIHPSATVGLGTNIINPNLVNIFGCTIGSDCMIGPFVEIQANVEVGNGTRVQSHSFICDGTSIGNYVFIGHGVMFTNDDWPRAANWDGTKKGADDWVNRPVRVDDWAAIGSGSVILPGVTIGRYATVGAGAVVTKDVPPFSIVVGNPARPIGDVRSHDPTLSAFIRLSSDPTTGP